MRLYVLVVALVCFTAFAQAEKVRFDQHGLARIFIENEQQRISVEALGLDAWSHESNIVIGENHVLLPPGMEATLASLKVPILGYMINDVQAIIDQQEAERLSRKKDAADDFFRDYHDFEEIVYETKRLAEQSDIVTYVPSIGKSLQGRVSLPSKIRVYPTNFFFLLDRIWLVSSFMVDLLLPLSGETDRLNCLPMCPRSFSLGKPTSNEAPKVLICTIAASMPENGLAPPP